MAVDSIKDASLAGYLVSGFFPNLKVPEGHHTRSTTFREALQGNLPLRGLWEGLSEGSAGVSQRALRGSAGIHGVFRGFSGVVTLCL